MLAKNLIECCHHPLHKREFHPENAVGASPGIAPGVEDIHILFVEIVNIGLSLSLAPYMHTHQVFTEMVPVHCNTDDKNEKNYQVSDFTIHRLQK